MSLINGPVNIAILDDYQNIALEMADWSSLDRRATIMVFNDHLADTDRVVERLLPFDAVCVMRERTPLSRAIIERLPRLKLIASTAFRNASIDIAAAAERNIAGTAYRLRLQPHRRADLGSDPGERPAHRCRKRVSPFRRLATRDR
jgi:lactate dehydrogenase-like 2-hydroxyacid dehydrogenase